MVAAFALPDFLWVNSMGEQYLFTISWWRWGESNPRLENIDSFDSYAIVA